MPTNTEKKPGCLTAIFSIFNRCKPANQENLPYRLRDDFLSPAEFSFYKVLFSMVGSRLVILTKVRLADIFFVSRPNENVAFLNRISQRHIDFLLCVPATMKPVVGVELDDSSHSTSARQQRDEFVDGVFQTAGLPLLHMPVKHDYSSREISDQLSQLIREKPPVTSAMQSHDIQPRAIPICPKCGIPMVLRTAGQGDHKGQQFYGCSNYPRCREVLPVTRAA